MALLNTEMIACDVLVGLPRQPMDNGVRPDMEDLRSEMQRLHIDGAVVRHRLAADAGPLHGNRVLMEEIGQDHRLLGAWALTPDGFEPQFDVQASVRQMLQSGARIGWISPKDHCYSPSPWCCGDLYEILQERRIPVLIDYAVVSGDELNSILSAFPRLRVILLGVPRLGRNRNVYGLLKRHPSLHMVFGPTYSVRGGIEDLVKNFGHERFLWGINYPIAEVGSAITQWTYAELNDEARKAIGSGNIRRLIREVRHD